ncbi:DUF523 domain-containing protein [Christensenellaceae bacterium OttesenSCG-928-M15]|nr:DUF523 domain-containing protein [Christensenellaceae bacterium OttesenSCG-928-M15]
MEKVKIIVSACLLGDRCRYDASAETDEKLKERYADKELIAVCPELMGGLQVPRLPAEIQNGDGADVLSGRARILDKEGHDVTEAFCCGAYAVLKRCEERAIKEAILKGRSPSCGCGAIYDGTFSGTLRAGDGVTAALLRQNGITVQTR